MVACKERSVCSRLGRKSMFDSIQQRQKVRRGITTTLASFPSLARLFKRYVKMKLQVPYAYL